MHNEILYKTYSYANGKYEEQVIYKEDVMEISLDKVEISKDSPEYENICSQMRSTESFGAVALNNELFYDSYEIMYDYYDGRLTQDNVKKLIKDYLYYSVGEAEENNIFQQKRVTAILSRLYEMFTRGNVRNAANQNHREGQQFLKENALEGTTEFYYNSKWYYACEDMQKMLQETANELVEEYGAEQVNFEKVIENTAYTLAGGLSFNGVWNWMNLQTNRPSPLGEDNYLEEDFVPPENFIYCSGNAYQINTNGTKVEKNLKELTGKELLNSVFLYIYKRNSTITTGSFFLDENNWDTVIPEENIYTKVTDILKKFHIGYFDKDRFEFLWMGNEEL